MNNPMSGDLSNPDLRPYFTERDLVTLRPVPGKQVVNSMDWHRLGGCQTASITVSLASNQDLYDLQDMLRCGVEIRDWQDTPAWWGYVHEVQVRIGSLEYGASLASMYNQLAVAYSFVDPGTQVVGQRKTTAWASNLASQGTFGIRELINMGDGMSDTAASGLRDVMVAQQAWPMGLGSQGFGQPRGRARYSGAENSASATLLCRGWWDTLKWRYAYKTATASTETTAQIADQVGLFGQFITGVDVATPSGVYLSQFQSGDKLVAEMVEELLNMGGPSARRMVAYVGRERRLRLWEEPAKEPPEYQMDRWAQLYAFPGGEMVAGYKPPVACWVRLADLAGAQANLGTVTDPTLQFVESAQWSTDSGLMLRFRGQPGIEDIKKLLR